MDKATINARLDTWRNPSTTSATDSVATTPADVLLGRDMSPRQREVLRGYIADQLIKQ